MEIVAFSYNCNTSEMPMLYDSEGGEKVINKQTINPTFSLKLFFSGRKGLK